MHAAALRNGAVFVRVPGDENGFIAQLRRECVKMTASLLRERKDVTVGVVMERLQPIVKLLVPYELSCGGREEQGTYDFPSRSPSHFMGKCSMHFGSFSMYLRRLHLPCQCSTASCFIALSNLTTKNPSGSQRSYVHDHRWG